MSALDTAALIIEYGNLSVGDDAGSAVNVGALRNVRFTGGQVRTRVESDNLGTVINKIRLQGKVEAELLEVGNMSVLNEIFKGIVTRTTTAGSPVTGATVVKTSGQWAYNQPILLTGQNADGTAPTITSVVGSTDGALTANLDYVKVKDPDTGLWYVQVIDSTAVTTQSQTITITYNYTPAASQNLTGGTNQTATSRYVKIEGPSEDDASVKRTVVLSDAVVSSDMVIPFVNVENANDVGVMPVTFESNKGTSWTITDAINPS